MAREEQQQGGETHETRGRGERGGRDRGEGRGRGGRRDREERTAT